MNFTDALAATSPKKRTRLEAILEEIGEEDARLVEKALKDKDMPSQRIANALRKMGKGISPASVQNYRRANRYV